MRLLKDPKSPLPIRIVSWIVALIVGALIVRLVFTFGYYASGLAADDAARRRLRETPIRLEFADPNANAPAPAPQPD